MRPAVGHLYAGITNYYITLFFGTGRRKCKIIPSTEIQGMSFRQMKHCFLVETKKDTSIVVNCIG